jgi:hypothetical protein
VREKGPGGWDGEGGVRVEELFFCVVEGVCEMGKKGSSLYIKMPLRRGCLINRACAKLSIRPGSGSERWGFPNRADQRIRKKNLACYNEHVLD